MRAAAEETLADAIVRLEERNIRADELLAETRTEQIRLQSSLSDARHRIADSLDSLAARFQPSAPAAAPRSMSPQELLSVWRSKNLVVTDDVHAVAAWLAPALVRGPARCRLEEVAERTGLTLDRVHDCLRVLLKRGCMRQAGCAEDGVPVYVPP